jgi:hypothetical protein
MIENEKVLGTIIYAANTVDYEIQHIVFATKQVLGVSSVLLNEAAQNKAELGYTGLLLAGVKLYEFDLAQDGLSYLFGMKAWGDLRRKVVGKPTISCKEEPLSPELFKTRRMRIPYEKVKEVTIKKKWGADDIILKMNTGFLQTYSWLLASSLDETMFLIQKTPLVNRLKQE